MRTETAWRALPQLPPRFEVQEGKPQPPGWAAGATASSGEIWFPNWKNRAGDITDPAGKQDISPRTVWALCAPRAGAVLERSPRGLW